MHKHIKTEKVKFLLPLDSETNICKTDAEIPVSESTRTSHSRLGVGYRLAVIVSEISMQISCYRGLQAPNMIKPHYHALPSGHASRPKKKHNQDKIQAPTCKETRGSKQISAGPQPCSFVCGRGEVRVSAEQDDYLRMMNSKGFSRKPVVS